MSLGNNYAESGLNAGSDYQINSYNDAGAFIGTPLAINRSNSVVSINGVGVAGGISNPGPVGDARLYLNRASGSFLSAILGTNNGLTRWSIIPGGGGAESGSNAGSDFQINRYTDAGAFIDQPLIINRATGTAYFGSTITAAGVVQTNTQFSINIPTVASTAPIYGSLNSKARWGIFLGNGQAETGSNVGSDFQINSYNDAGATLAVPLIINRANSTAFFGGALYVTSGNIASQAKGGGNAQVAFADNAGNIKGYCYWDVGTNSVRLSHPSGANVACLPSGAISLSGPMQGVGVSGRQGQNGGSYGSIHNWFWGGGAIQAWVDTTNLGNVSLVSDYRIKKGVADLPSMWETLKALRPIKYTQAEFSPPSHVKYIAEEKLKARKAAEDDPELRRAKSTTRRCSPLTTKSVGASSRTNCRRRWSRAPRLASRTAPTRSNRPTRGPSSPL